MTALTSLILRSARTGVLSAMTLNLSPGEAGLLTLDGRVLELVEVGPRVEQRHDALDRVAGEHLVGALGGSIHDANEHGLIAGDEGGDAPDVVACDDRFML